MSDLGNPKALWWPWTARPEAETSSASDNAPAAAVSAVPFSQAADAQLIERTLHGERDAFGELARRHEISVLQRARRFLRDPDEAEDIAQEAFLRAYRALPSFSTSSPGGSFRAWILRITTNLALDALRRRSSTESRATMSLEDLPEGGATLPSIDSISPPEHLDSMRLAQRLETALRSLSPDAAAAIELRYREGLSVVEIASLRGMAAGTVAVTLLRARKRLKKLLVPSETETSATVCQNPRQEKPYGDRNL